MTIDAGAWVGQMLDNNRYKVVAQLGEGGMGFVYRARDRRLGSDVVIKVPRAEMLADAEFRQRFAQEIRALVKLSHPHVVKVTDVGKHDGIPFAVMQFLPGGSLEDKRATGGGKPQPSDPAQLAAWLPAVADALDFIHEQGYVHRDVKPANILFDGHGHAYISDFGVAKTLAERKRDRRGLTEAGMVLGTPEYMAPELVMGQPFDGRADQYALAITVYELLSGAMPFDGPTGPAILVKQTTQTPPPLTVHGQTPELSAAVLKAMAKTPSERYSTCTEFAKVVIAACAAPRVKTAPIGDRETLRTAALEFDTLPEGKLAAPPRSRRTLQIGVAAGVGLAGAAAVASIWALSGTKPRPVKPEVAAVAPSVAPNPKVEPAPEPKPKVEPAAPPKTKPPEPKPKAEPPPAPEPKAPPAPKSQPKTQSKPQPKASRNRPAAGLDGQIRSISIPSGSVRGMAVSPDGHTIVVASSGAPIRGYDTHTGLSQSSVMTHRGGGGLAFLVGGRVLVYGLSDGAVRAHDFESARDSAMIGSHTRPVTCIAATKEVAISGADDGARAWNMINGRQIWSTPGRDYRVTAVAVTANGLTAYLAVNGVISVRSARGGSESRRFGSPQDPVRSLALSSDGNSLAAGCTTGKIIIYDPRSGDEKKELAGHSGVVTVVAFAADGKRVISGGDDKSVRLWDLAEGKEIGRFEGHTGEITGATILPDGRTGVSASIDGTVRVLNLVELISPKP